MAGQDFQTLLPKRGSKQVDVSYKDQIVHTVYSDIPFRAPGDFPTASAPAGHTILNTVPVTFLTEHNVSRLTDFVPDLQVKKVGVWEHLGTPGLFF